MRSFLLLGAAALFMFAGPLAAQAVAQTTSAPETRRAVVDEFDDVADRPSAPIKVVIPARVVAVPVTPELGADDNLAFAAPVEELPVTPEEAAPVVERPTFFGVSVGSLVAFCLDRSGSMGTPAEGVGAIEDHNGATISSPSRLQVMKAEVIKVLNGLQPTDKYGIVSFGSYPTTAGDPFMLEASEANVKASVNKVSTLVANGATPTQTGLARTFELYGPELTNLFFLSDGEPNCGQSATSVLAWFPSGYKTLKDNGCHFVSIHMGADGPTAEFMQSIANIADGTYIRR